jgi:hypothetical protein
MATDMQVVSVKVSCACLAIQVPTGWAIVASKKPFYASEPAVPAKKVAGENPVGKVQTPGVFKPTSVPLHPGRTHALGPVLRQPHPKAHGFGHKAHQIEGALRLSGVPHAHKVGVPKTGKKL